jgi:hypothetical protein
MADNRIFVKCRFCAERTTDHGFGLTLARFGYGHEWEATGNNFAQFVQDHMHRDEPDWYSKGYYYEPFQFEYEDTNYEMEERNKRVDLMAKITESE